MRFGAHEYISIRSDLWLTNAKEDINEKFWEKNTQLWLRFQFCRSRKPNWDNVKTDAQKAWFQIVSLVKPEKPSIQIFFCLK